MERSLKRGQICWADLGERRGAKPAFRRPVLIVEDDLLIQSRLKTVMVVPLTTNLKRAIAVGNVLLSARDTGLERESVALVCQVMTIDKVWLTEVVASLPRRIIAKVNQGLKLSLGLSV